MRLLAAGRESEIFDLGDGRVLRRYKQGGRPEHEAMVMEHARTHGFPSPRVFELGAGELVLERVDGPSMVEDLARRPWRVPRHARLLAGLHRRLHRIEAPEGLEAAGPGDAFSTSTSIPATFCSPPRGRSSSTGRIHAGATRHSTSRCRG